MKNWEETDEHGQCMAAQDFEDVVEFAIRLEFLTIQ